MAANATAFALGRWALPDSTAERIALRPLQGRRPYHPAKGFSPFGIPWPQMHPHLLGRDGPCPVCAAERIALRPLQGRRPYDPAKGFSPFGIPWPQMHPHLLGRGLTLPVCAAACIALRPQSVTLGGPFPGESHIRFPGRGLLRPGKASPSQAHFPTPSRRRIRAPALGVSKGHHALWQGPGTASLAGS